MCLEKPGPRCSGHTRTKYHETKAALKEANADLEQKKQALEVAQSAEAKAALEASEKAHAVAAAEFNTATANYLDSKAKRAVAMEAYRTAKDEYNASPEGIKKNRQRSVDKKLTDEQREEARQAAIEGNAARNRAKEAYAFKKALDEAEKTAVEADITATGDNDQIRSEIGKLASVSQSERLELATQEDSHSHTLAALSQDSDPRVRYAVAGNRSAPPEVLAKLALDKSEGGVIAERVASNPSTPGEVLSEMTKRQGMIKFVAMENPSLPQVDIHRLASNENSWAHTYLVSNPAASADALRNLAKSDELHVVQAVATHKNASDDTLLTLATHKSVKVREAIAEHPNSSPETLRTILSAKGTKGIDVLWALTSNKRSPIDVLESIAAMPTQKGGYGDVVRRAAHVLRYDRGVKGY